MARSPTPATDGKYNHANPSDRMTRALGINRLPWRRNPLPWRLRATLAQIAKQDGTSRGCTASLETLAAELNEPRWKVAETLGDLVEAKLLAVTAGQTTSTRRVVWPDESHRQGNPDTGNPTVRETLTVESHRQGNPYSGIPPSGKP